MRKSVTLVELLISIVLLGVMVLGATAFHLSGERFLSSSEKKTQVLNDLTFVLQHLHKNVLLGTGDYNNPGIVASAGVLNIRQDIDAAGNPNFTPTDYSDDRIVAYLFGIATSPKSIMFSNDGAPPWETLTRCFIDLGGSNDFGINIADGGVEITNLALMLDPTLPADPSKNPQVTTIDTGGNRTVYFYPLVHSWQ